MITDVAAAERWRVSLADLQETLRPEDARAIQGELEIQVRTRDELEATEQPAPPSYTWMYWSAFGALLAAIASLWVTARLAQTSSWIFVSAQTAALLAGIAARRLQALRIPSLGWIAVAILGTAVAVITAVNGAIN